MRLKSRSGENAELWMVSITINVAANGQPFFPLCYVVLMTILLSYQKRRTIKFSRGYFETQQSHSSLEREYCSTTIETTVLKHTSNTGPTVLPVELYYYIAHHTIMQALVVAVCRFFAPPTTHTDTNQPFSEVGSNQGLAKSY